MRKQGDAVALLKRRIAFPYLNKMVNSMGVCSLEKLQRTAVLDLLSSGVAPASLDLKELFHLPSANYPIPGVQSKCM